MSSWLPIILVVGLVALVVGVYFTLADWRTRGPRYLVSVALALTAVIFAGWLKWGYKPPRKPKDYELVKNRVVIDFDQKTASRLTITRSGKSVTLEKRKGKWILTKPVTFPADHDAVENLLSEIRMLDRDKSLPGPRTRAEYGLAKKEIVVRVEGATRSPLTLTIGGEDVTGNKIYLARNEEDRVLVVNKHFKEAMDKSLDDLRDTATFRFSTSKLKSIQLTTDDGRPARLSVKDKSWTLRMGADRYGQRANAKVAEDLARKLQDLRASRFLADGKDALARHGLDKPTRTMVADDGQRHELLIGGACDKHEGEVKAGRRGKYPAVFCLRRRELKDLFVRAETLRDARLTGIDETAVSSVHIKAAGKEILLKKTGIDWEVKKPVKTETKKVSAQQVEKFVKDLGAYTVLTYLSPPEGGLAGMGLAKPRAEITLTDDDGRKEIIKLGGENPDKNYYAQRSGEQLAVVIHREAGELFKADLLRFRKLDLLSFSRQPNEAVEITARTGAATETASYEGGIWQLTRPLKIKADSDAMENLLGVLAEFKAVRYVAQAPLPAHGLANPTRTLTIKLEKEDFSASKPGKKTETHTFKIGADAPKGGCYGLKMGKNEPVFLIKAAHCKDLRALLVTRRVAELRASQVKELKLTRGGGSEHLERRGPHWGRKKGPRVNATRVEDLLTTVASMRALRTISYGVPTGHGLQKPSIRLELTTKDKKDNSIVISIGDPYKEQDKVVGHYVARQGRAVLYILPLSTVENLRKAKF